MVRLKSPKTDSHGIIPLDTVAQLMKLFSALGFCCCLYLLLPPVFYGKLRNLDPAFQIALQMSSQLGLSWGRDTIFTYGPLVFLTSRLPFAGVRMPLLAFDLLLYGHLIYICYFAFRRVTTLPEILCISFAVFIFSPEFYFLDLSIVLFSVYIFSLFHFLQSRSLIALGSLCVLSILLFFIKLNTGIFAIGLTPLCLLLLAHKEGSFRLPSTALVLYAIATTAFAQILNVDLPGYIRSAFHIISGYNEAMFIPPDGHEAYLYCALAVLSIFALITLRHSRTILQSWRTTIQIGITALALFTLFKQSFVRADEHMLAFLKYACLPIGVLYLFIEQRLKTAVAIVFLVAMLGGLAQGSNRYRWISPAEKWAGLRSYMTDALGPDLEGRDRDPIYAEASLPEEALQKLRSGSVDAMPQHADIIYFNNLSYNPRPMHMASNTFDSYIDGLNAAKYLSSTAPSFVIFGFSNEERLYGFEYETRTKEALLMRYRPVLTYSRLLILEKQPRATPLVESLERSAQITWGDEIALESESTLKILKIMPRYSLLGHLRKLVYQPPPIKITFTLEDGSRHTFDMMRPVMENGFIASHYVRSPEAYLSFFEHNFDALPKVRSVRLTTSMPWGFAQSYSYQILRIAN